MLLRAISFFEVASGLRRGLSFNEYRLEKSSPAFFRDDISNASLNYTIVTLSIFASQAQQTRHSLTLLLPTYSRLRFVASERNDRLYILDLHERLAPTFAFVVAEWLDAVSA